MNSFYKKFFLLSIHLIICCSLVSPTHAMEVESIQESENSLPQELWILIINFLSPQALNKCKLINKFFNHEANGEYYRRYKKKLQQTLRLHRQNHEKYWRDRNLIEEYKAYGFCVLRSEKENVEAIFDYVEKGGSVGYCAHNGCLKNFHLTREGMIFKEEFDVFVSHAISKGQEHLAAVLISLGAQLIKDDDDDIAQNGFYIKVCGLLRSIEVFCKEGKSEEVTICLRGLKDMWIVPLVLLTLDPSECSSFNAPLLLSFLHQKTISQEVLAELCCAGADLDMSDYQGGYDHIHTAVLCENEPLIGQLIEQNQDNCFKESAWDHYTPLQLAARYGKLSILKKLIACGGGIDINFRKAGKPDALRYALMGGYSDCASYLSEQGAVFATDGGDACNLWRETANVACLDILKRAGVNINAPDERSNTALIWTCDPFCSLSNEQRIEKIIWLLDNSAEVNAQGDGGETALQRIVWFEREKKIELARLLLERGADPELEDVHGQSVVIYSNGCCDLIQEYLTSDDDETDDEEFSDSDEECS